MYLANGSQKCGVRTPGGPQDPSRGSVRDQITLYTVLQPKAYNCLKAEAQMRIQLTSIKSDTEEICKVSNNATLLPNFLL